MSTGAYIGLMLLLALGGLSLAVLARKTGDGLIVLASAVVVVWALTNAAGMAS